MIGSEDGTDLGAELGAAAKSPGLFPAEAASRQGLCLQLDYANLEPSSLLVPKGFKLGIRELWAPYRPPL